MLQQKYLPSGRKRDKWFLEVASKTSYSGRKTKVLFLVTFCPIPTNLFSDGEYSHFYPAFLFFDPYPLPIFKLSPYSNFLWEAGKYEF